MTNDRVVFIKGMRVRALFDIGESIRRGFTGTIYKDSSATAYVEWDEDISGHNGAGIGTQGHCWNVPIDYVVSPLGDWDD